METLKPGIYQHYKGNEYELLFVAEQSETKESMVIYRSLADNKVWTRPAIMWSETVTVAGKDQPRFTWLREAQPRYPEAVVGPIIYNDDGEILLIKNPKNTDVWTIPGGHIEWGEEMEDTLRREIEEETSLQIDKIEFVSAVDGIKPDHFLKTKHFIFLNFFAHLAGGTPQLSNEMSEYIWVEPARALTELSLASSVTPLIEKFINQEPLSQDAGEEKYKRALADYQNLLKQVAKDKTDFVKFALNDFLQDLIPVYDHLKMSLSSLPENEQESAWVKGVGYVLKQFKEVLDNRGVVEIKTVGEKFNHDLMDALEGKGDKVIKEVMSGYTLNGRLLRPAKVIVGEE